MKIVTILGARPQFVKAGAISREIAKFSDIQEVIVHTGQHFDENMSAVFFQDMDIPRPQYHLQIHSLQHGAMTGRMLEKIEEVLLVEKPDWVIVYGDTNSTLAGALAAKKQHLKVAHIEAGLRSFNMQMPEEINRILTDRISDFLFCPTLQAMNNLRAEGFDNFPCQFILSGDVMEDAALYYAEKASAKSDILAQLHLSPNSFFLCTIHRAENLNDTHKLEELVSTINHIHTTICPVVLPLHPGTAKKLETSKLRLVAQVIPPIGYFDMLTLLKNCRMVLTDSGGLQKEAYFFNKFCITLREETEWVELVEGGYNFITGIDKSAILQALEITIRKSFLKEGSYYGGGKAAKQIIKSLYAKSPSPM